MKRLAGVGSKLWTASLLACASLATQAAETVSKPGIYVCIDAQGRKITSDRPIAECLDRDQRLLNADGSQRGVHQRYMTATERAAYEEAQHRKQQEAVAKMDAVRRDRNLLMRYPNEAAHEKARAAALDDVRSSIENSKKRLLELDRERKPLLNEAEFYAGKPLPTKLKRQLDDNEVSAEAQKTLIQNQEVEMQRVTNLYDVELVKLKRLWAGSPPGSLEDADRAASAAAAKAASAPKPGK
ncbi:hypothetical protein [Aquabacterium sp.]|uniref:hypothetical protein n=1 Tax=Aquabacterium sp. TaxID=1872578 RepID=UPI0035AD9D8D